MLRSETVVKLRDTIAAHRAAGRRIGFVPTMGALHEGHLALVRECRVQCDVVVVSIYVNPLQFGPAEDFSKYPRAAEKDVALAASAGADICFLPADEEMYPAGSRREVRVECGEIAARWEGAVRPGHFAGVLTVVAKLLNIVAPDDAFFGQKDFQQATLVRAMVRDLNFPTAIRVMPTVRDRDGLALSSRNAYLTADARARASSIPRALASVHRRWAAGETNPAILEAHATGSMRNAGIDSIDYCAIVDAESLAPAEVARDGAVLLVAARVDGTRLIDNMIFSTDLPAGLPMDAGAGL